MKFQKDDLVVVRNDCKTKDLLLFAEEMNAYKNGIFKIKYSFQSNGENRYTLVDVYDESGYYWNWAEEWLDFAESENEINIEDDDFVSVLMGE